MPFAPIQDVIAAIAAGEMVILADDEDRENEATLSWLLKHAREAIAFMATRACGLICLALDGPLVDQLQLPMMASDNRSRMGTAFTVSIEAAEGVTGISARTVRTPSRWQLLRMPGHIRWCRQGTCSRCEHVQVACSSAWAKPRARLISLAWQDDARRA